MLVFKSNAIFKYFSDLKKRFLFYFFYVCVSATCAGTHKVQKRVLALWELEL